MLSPQNRGLAGAQVLVKEDGSCTVHFGGDLKSTNYLYIMEGWNYTVRLYQPRKEIHKGKWTFQDVKSLHCSWQLVCENILIFYVEDVMSKYNNRNIADRYFGHVKRHSNK